MITVLGASGFIGSNIVNELAATGSAFYAPKRDESLRDKDLGHAIYCIGMTADFRTKPFETAEAHVSKLADVLQYCSFESLTYLSSTRVYIKSKTDNRYLTEADNIVVNSNDPSDIFAASKITGELLALNSGKKNIKVVRPSNVFGIDIYSQNFITAIVKEALKNSKVELLTTPDSAKDYIFVGDVCSALIKLAQQPQAGIYNLCSGTNTNNKDIVEELSRLTGAEIVYSPEAQQIIFQEISNAKVRNVIDFKPTTTVLDALPEIIAAFKN